MNTIRLGDRSFKFTIKRKPVRSLRLKLKTKSSFEITCPILMPNIAINRFLSQNANWIIKNSAKIHLYPKIKSLKTIKILGDNYKLAIVKNTKESIIISNKEQTIYLYSKVLTESHLKKIFEKEFRQISLSLINFHLNRLRSQYGFKFNRISVRNQRSRFASCSSAGNLNFNWQIIFFPLDKFLHLLFHELTHLTIKNHSKSFYTKLGEYDPHWKINNRWLSVHGRQSYLLKP